MVYFLLPNIHLLAFARFGVFYVAGFVTVRTALSHPAVKCRGRVVNVPPIIFAPFIAAVAGHRLQIEAGAQALGGNGVGDDAAIAIIKYAVTRYISGFVPEPTNSSDVA